MDVEIIQISLAICINFLDDLIVYTDGGGRHFSHVKSMDRE